MMIDFLKLTNDNTCFDRCDFKQFLHVLNIHFHCLKKDQNPDKILDI